MSRCAPVTYPSFDIHAEKDVPLFKSTVNLHYLEEDKIQFQTVNLNPNGKKILLVHLNSVSVFWLCIVCLCLLKLLFPRI